MACCEKCWRDAARAMLLRGVDQVEEYHRLLKERDASGQVCTPEQQRGEVRRVTIIVDKPKGSRNGE